MIKKSESFSVTCDHCGESLITSHEGFSLFVDEDNAHEQADNEGWYMEEGRGGEYDHYYCKKCFWIGDDDEMHLRMERRKPALFTNNQREGEKVLRWVKASERLPKYAGSPEYHFRFGGLKVNGNFHYSIDDERCEGDIVFTVFGGGCFQDYVVTKERFASLEWLEETVAPAAQPTEIPQLPANQVWDLSGIPDDQKHAFVDGMVKITAENFLKVFVMLGLKDGIESGVVNQATGDQFILIFKKLKYPAPPPAQTPSLPVEEGAQWFNKWMQQKFEERGRYKQTFDEWTHYSKGACDMEETLRGQITSLCTQLAEAQKDRDAYKNQAAELRELIVGQAHKSQD